MTPARAAQVQFQLIHLVPIRIAAAHSRLDGNYYYITGVYHDVAVHTLGVYFVLRVCTHSTSSGSVHIVLHVRVFYIIYEAGTVDVGRSRRRGRR